MLFVASYFVVYIFCQLVSGETKVTLTPEVNHVLEGGNATFTCRITTDSRNYINYAGWAGIDANPSNISTWRYYTNQQVWFPEEVNPTVSPFLARVNFTTNVTQTEHIYQMHVQNVMQSDSGYEIICGIYTFKYRNIKNSSLVVRSTATTTDLQTQTKTLLQTKPLPPTSDPSNFNSYADSSVIKAASHCFEIQSVYIFIAISVLGWILAITMGSILIYCWKHKSVSPSEKASTIVMTPMGETASQQSLDKNGKIGSNESQTDETYQDLQKNDIDNSVYTALKQRNEAKTDYNGKSQFDTSSVKYTACSGDRPMPNFSQNEHTYTEVY